MVLTGKYHTQFRDYDPLHCKWLSRDPIAEAGGVNLTGYCGNNPLGGVDELGLRGPEGVWDVVGTPGLWIIGFGQGLWAQVSGIGQLVAHPIDSVKGIGSAIWNYGDTYGAIKQMVNEELDAADASYAEMVMLEGRITAEVASLFIGVGELSALAKGGKVAAALSKANLVVKAKVAAALGRAAPVVKAAENVLEKTAKAGRVVAREARVVEKEGKTVSRLTVTGRTRSGMNRVSREWRTSYGPSVLRKHHLGPQELLKNARFMRRMEELGYDATTAERFVHRQIAHLTQAKHVQIHASGWNQKWMAWLNRTPDFTIRNLRAQTRLMRKEFDIPKASLGYPAYR